MAKRRISKLDVWFRYFIDESNLTTFLNKTESSRAAKYKTKNEDSLRQIGCQNFRKLTKEVSAWLDEAGLSENALKIKMLSLIDAKEAKFQKIKGAVLSDLPENVSVIAESGNGLGEEGLLGMDVETLLQIDVDALNIQTKALDLALKMKGMNAPVEHTIDHKGAVIEVLALLPTEVRKLLEEKINDRL